MYTCTGDNAPDGTQRREVKKKIHSGSLRLCYLSLCPYRPARRHHLTRNARREVRTFSAPLTPALAPGSDPPSEEVHVQEASIYALSLALASIHLLNVDGLSHGSFSP